MTPIAKVLCLGFVLLLSACTARPGPGVLTAHPEVAGGHPEAQVIRVYAATNRALAAGFEGQPAFATSYRFYDISVPPERGLARISYPGETPDPATDFVVTASGVLERAEFLAQTRRAGGAKRDLALYVHGYNTSFQEALFRLAQISAEAHHRVAPVLFSWPSRGKPLDYEADRQAALFSRNALRDLVTGLTAGGRPLVLFGHSMGGFLVVETLRDLQLAGQTQVLARLDVVLAAPDIDVFVFASQLETLGHLPRPILILTSQGDRALGLSSRLAGGRPRVGALPAAAPMVGAAARRANVQIIDISSVRADPLGHQRYVGMVELYARAEAEPPELRVPGAFIFDALTRSLVAQ
ncbi:alpha/beta hydrolase [Oceanicola sp. S124]|uniref:alpha/beta hydrolase n=1 Tax=Oceanicola sp. S124 TaxID=1042378 RepID=UPI0002557E50|nr:alpha/beta fold hydrolase [Oceanicola sp. S124]